VCIIVINAMADKIEKIQEGITNIIRFNLHYIFKHVHFSEGNFGVGDSNRILLNATK